MGEGETRAKVRGMRWSGDMETERERHQRWRSKSKTECELHSLKIMAVSVGAVRKILKRQEKFGNVLRKTREVLDEDRRSWNETWKICATLQTK